MQINLMACQENLLLQAQTMLGRLRGLPAKPETATGSIQTLAGDFLRIVTGEFSGRKSVFISALATCPCPSYRSNLLRVAWFSIPVLNSETVRSGINMATGLNDCTRGHRAVKPLAPCHEYWIDGESHPTFVGGPAGRSSQIAEKKPALARMWAAAVSLNL